ncbi:hypothetical protein EDB89DRAFT_1964999 [Lactarius sanguifluus]|nr:hypothetical protein EDB89DRAFT_1964999 [Lactarius sanguifluus]
MPSHHPPLLVGVGECTSAVLPFSYRLLCVNEIRPLDCTRNSRRSDSSRFLDSLISRFPPRRFTLAITTSCSLSLCLRPRSDLLGTPIHSQILVDAPPSGSRMNQGMGKIIEVLLELDMASYVGIYLSSMSWTFARSYQLTADSVCRCSTEAGHKIDYSYKTVCL